jgi:hypothetical protein
MSEMIRNKANLRDLNEEELQDYIDWEDGRL